MSDKRFDFSLCDCKIYDKEEERLLEDTEVCGLLNEQQEQLDLYKEAILTMLGLLAEKGIIFSGVKDE